MSARVLLYEPHCTEDRRSGSSLRRAEFELVECSDIRSLLEQVVQGHAGALVFALCDEHEEDLGGLRLIRRAAPDLPLVLLVEDESLAARRELQNLNPIYYAVCPPEPAELLEAVRAAVLKSARPRTTAARRAHGA